MDILSEVLKPIPLVVWGGPALIHCGVKAFIHGYIFIVNECDRDLAAAKLLDAGFIRADWSWGSTDPATLQTLDEDVQRQHRESIPEYEDIDNNSIRFVFPPQFVRTMNEPIALVLPSFVKLGPPRAATLEPAHDETQNDGQSTRPHKVAKVQELGHEENTLQENMQCEGTSRDHRLQEDTPQKDKPQEDNSKEHEPQEREPQEHEPQEHEPQEHEPQEYEPQEYEPQEYEPQEYEPQEHEPQEHEPQEDKAQEDMPQDAVLLLEPQEHEPQEDEPQEDEPQEDEPQEDKPQEDEPQEDKAQEDKPQEDKAQEDKPQEDKAQEDKPQDAVLLLEPQSRPEQEPYPGQEKRPLKRLQDAENTSDIEKSQDGRELQENTEDDSRFTCVDGFLYYPRLPVLLETLIRARLRVPEDKPSLWKSMLGVWAITYLWAQTMAPEDVLDGIEDEEVKAWFNKATKRFEGGMDRVTITKRKGRVASTRPPVDLDTLFD